MENVKEIVFHECNEMQTVETRVLLDNTGHMLTVPVYLYNVCPCSKLIVGVQIYVKGDLYAMKTKEVFTAYSRCCRKIRQMYVGEFDFLFTNNNTSNIDIRVLAHYIC